MSGHSHEGSDVADPLQSFLRRHDFLLRRLHSLTGIVPVGVYLIEHLLTNSTAFLGPKQFNEHVQWIQDLPFLLALEILFIFLPLAFHAIYGVKIALEGKPNQNQYPYMDNWRYTLQRVTAWITLAFVLVHVLHFRFAHWFGRMPYGDAHVTPGFFLFTQQGFTDLLLPLWLWMLIYVVGLAASVYHFCNGIATFCITWGITVGDQSRKRILVASSGLAVVLMAWGLLSLYALGRVGDAQRAAPLRSAAAVTHVGE